MIKNFQYSLFLLFIFTVTLSLPIEQANGAEDDVYNFTWLDPDKEVYVLQNRKFRKVGKFHLNLGGGITTSGAFVDATTIQFRGGYFFKEDWGFEVIYAMNNGSENSTAQSVRNQGPGGTASGGSTPFRRIVDDYYGVLGLWSPFYAKVNTFNSIVYIDWMLGLGFGKLKETNNREFLNQEFNPQDITETHTGLIWETALQLYLSESWMTRLDLTAFHYKAQRAIRDSASSDKVWSSNFDLSLSLGFRF